MDANFVTEIMQRSNRNLALRSGLGLLLVVIALVFSRKYLTNFLNGPYAVGPEHILAITDVNQADQTFITVTGDGAAYSGYNEFEISDSGAETITRSYGLLFFGDRLMLVEVQGDQTEFPSTFTGFLVPTPDDIQRDIIVPLGLEIPEMAGAFLPFMMKTEDFRFNGYIGIGIGGVVLLLSMIGLLRVIRRNSDATLHPIMRKLARFDEPDIVAEQQDQEMQQDHLVVGNVHLTRNWLIHRQKADLDATRLKDLMWAYKKVTQHRTYGIPVKKTFATLIWDRHNVCITIPAGKEDQVHALLDSMLTTAPWIVIGFDSSIEQSWRRDRDNFIAAVDQRQREQRR